MLVDIRKAIYGLEKLLQILMMGKTFLHTIFTSFIYSIVLNWFLLVIDLILPIYLVTENKQFQPPTMHLLFIHSSNR